jgi:2-dehydropantoate 2-reductase
MAAKRSQYRVCRSRAKDGDMKLAIMGAGALGCYFGGRLVQSGADVTFVARGAHLKALQRDGLRIESPLGNALVAPVRATDDPSEIGPVDMVLFLVKLYDTEESARAMAPLLGPETAVASFQNGIDAWTRIGAIVGEERVLGGTAVISAAIRSPGVVSHVGSFARLTFGEFDGRASARCEALRAALERAGVEAAVVPDIRVKIWEKFIVLSAFSAVTALTRLPIGDVLADPQCRDLFAAAIAETHAVGRAACPALADDAGERALALAHGFPKSMRASMLDDLERGKRLELEHLSGAVARLGAAHGVATPVHEVAYKALHPFLEGRPPACRID